MADMYAVTEEQLGNIANAIRLKRDTTVPMTVDDMPLEISLIDGGGGGDTPFYSMETHNFVMPYTATSSNKFDTGIVIDYNCIILVFADDNLLPRPDGTPLIFANVTSFENQGYHASYIRRSNGEVGTDVNAVSSVVGNTIKLGGNYATLYEGTAYTLVKIKLYKED